MVGDGMMPHAHRVRHQSEFEWFLLSLNMVIVTISESEDITRAESRILNK